MLIADRAASFDYESFDRPDFGTLFHTLNAVQDGSTVALTQTTSNLGALWLRTPVYARGFETSFTFAMQGAAGTLEGLAFVMHNAPGGVSAVRGEIK